MQSTATLHPTLAHTLWPDRPDGAVVRGRAVRAIVLAVAGSLLLTLAAKIQIPFWPVPLTMQTFAVLVIGMAFGWRLGFATVLLYLVEGAVGLPVFSGTPARGIGIAYMLGPTGGYLVGFALAAAAVGWLAEHGWDRSFGRTIAAMLIGNGIIYVLGVPWLAQIVDAGRDIGFGAALPVAFNLGMLPFLIGDGLKILAAAAVLPTVWRTVVGRRRQN